MQKPLFIHAISPLHAGVGQGIGVIDLPIAREKATNLPYLPGSSLKGVMRSLFPENRRNQLFGPETKDASEYASPIQFSDQLLLLFPVRSLSGTFAYVTCPWVLQRLVRDLKAVGLTNLPSLPPVPQEDRILLPRQSLLSWSQGGASKVFFEDLDFTAQEEDKVEKLAGWLAENLFTDETDRQSLKERFAVISDDHFNYLVETATQVTARIRMEEQTKTVAKGALWYEEALPAESILWGVVLIENVPKSGIKPEQGLAELQEHLNSQKLVQLGGKATVGRGLCQLKLMEA